MLSLRSSPLPCGAHACGAFARRRKARHLCWGAPSVGAGNLLASYIYRNPLRKINKGILPVLEL